MMVEHGKYAAAEQMLFGKLVNFASLPNVLKCIRIYNSLMPILVVYSVAWSSRIPLEIEIFMETRRVEKER